jgi:hypothetical protein
MLLLAEFVGSCLGELFEVVHLLLEAEKLLCHLSMHGTASL